MAITLRPLDNTTAQCKRASAGFVMAAAALRSSYSPDMHAAATAAVEGYLSSYLVFCRLVGITAATSVEAVTLLAQLSPESTSAQRLRALEAVRGRLLEIKYAIEAYR